MFELSRPASSSITTMPPNPMMESFSPVLPSVRFAIGWLGVLLDACSEDAADAAAAVIAACLMNVRRSISSSVRVGAKIRRLQPAYANILAQIARAQNARAASRSAPYDLADGTAAVNCELRTGSLPPQLRKKEPEQHQDPRDHSHRNPQPPIERLARRSDPRHQRHGKQQPRRASAQMGHVVDRQRRRP